MNAGGSRARQGGYSSQQPSNQRAVGSEPGKGSKSAKLGGQGGPREVEAGTDEAVSGPLRPGMHVSSGRLQIWQVSAERAEIELDLQRIIIEGGQGERYRFFVDRQVSPAQRVVRIAATHGVSITKERREGPLAATAGDGPIELVVHERRVKEPGMVDAAPASPLGAATEAAERAALLGVADELPELDAELGPLGREPRPGRAHSDRDIQIVRTRHGVIVRLDDSQVEIEALDHRADFAVDLAPDWSGEGGRERVVHIVATPGVRISGADGPMGPDTGMGSYGRRLRPQVVRVQDPALVAHAKASATIEPSAYVPARKQTAGIRPDNPERGLTAAPGPSGVTIIESVSGVRLRVEAADPAVGARFAYQVVSPLEHGDPHRPAEIRVLAAPGTRIEVIEPFTKPPLGMPDDESFATANVELLLYEAWNPEVIPAQGAVLEPAFLDMAGTRREPDARTFAPEELEQQIGKAVADTGLSLLPGLGDMHDIGQAGYAAATGRDFHGDEVDKAALPLMLLVALVPLVGSKAARSALKQGSKAALQGSAEIAELTAKLGMRAEDAEELLIRMSELADEDLALLRRIERAAAAGSPLDSKDIERARALWSELQQRITLEVPPSALDGLDGGGMARHGEELGGLDDLGETGPELGAMQVRGRQGAGVATTARTAEDLDTQARGILTELERHLGADSRLVAVAEMVANMPKPEAYLRLVGRLAQSGSKAGVTPDGLRQLVKRSTEMAEPVTFLKDAKWLVELGLSRKGLENLTDKIARDKAPDLAWLRRCTLSLSDLEFLAAHPETSWKSFMKASRHGSEDLPVGVATHGVDVEKAVKNAYAQSRGAAGELLFESIELPGERTVLKRGLGYDYQLALPGGQRQGAEVKSWRPVTWVRYLKAGENSPQLQNLVVQLDKAAAKNPGMPPVLVLSDAVDADLSAAILQHLEKTGLHDVEIIAIPESEIQAIGKRLRKGMGIQ